MYTQFQRFIATILLFSILLQSCGHPGQKLLEPVCTSGEAGVPPQQPEDLVTEHQIDGQVYQEKYSSSTSTPSSHPAEPDTSACTQATTLAANNLGLVPPHSTPDTPQRATAAPTLPHLPSKKSLPLRGLSSRLHQLPRASTEPLTSPTAHVAQDPAQVPQQMHRNNTPAVTVSPRQSASPAPKTAAKAGTSAKVHAAPSSEALLHVASKTYSIAGGQQVSFREEAGLWKAQVQDVWGRMQKLPVLCGPNQTPTHALGALADKDPGEYKYCIHILETDQPPWASRVVYVGMLGLRGGGNSSSACTYPEGIKGDENSDDESDGEVYSGGYKFYRSKTDNWCVDRIDECGEGFFTKYYHSMRLSANDIRAIDSWGFHDCRVGNCDCYVPNISYKAILAQRQKRREERKKQQKEKCKKQEVATAKVATERHALVQEIGAEAAKTAKQHQRSWKQSVKKRQTQMKAALKCMSAPQATQQNHTQEHVVPPQLHNADSILTWPALSEEANSSHLEEDSKPAAVASSSVTNEDKANTVVTQSDETTQSDTSSVYGSVVEDNATTDSDENFVDAYDRLPDPLDPENTLDPVWANDVLALIDWNWQLEKDDTFSTPSDALSPTLDSLITPSNGTEDLPVPKPPTLSAPVATEQNASASILSKRSFSPIKNLKKAARALIVPFDNRPLAPLVQAVNRVCIQLNQSALETEELAVAIAQGEALLRLLGAHPYLLSTLDFNDRVLYKTIEEKLSGHVRLYQRLSTWAAQCLDEERTSFLTTIVPIVRKHLLSADTRVQQALLTYWEQGGTCYPDIIQENPVSDWLYLSLYQDIVQEALVNNNTLLQDLFTQRLGVLVEHEESFMQKKLLTRLLWSLRARQQACQWDLLELCKLMTWLPTDAQQAVGLLNSSSQDWYAQLRAYWLRPQLSVFEDRWSTQEIEELCNTLSHLPWEKNIMDYFLLAVSVTQDYTALQALLTFLSKYPIEEEVLLDVFCSEPPERITCPTHYFHHTLACDFLEKLVTQLFYQHSEAVQSQLESLLQHHLGAYDTLYTLLSSLASNEATSQERQEQALQLREVLSLSDDYNVTTAVYIDTFQALTQQPVQQWEATAHRLAVAATFCNSYELSVQEVIDNIVEGAPSVYFAGDTHEMRSSYEALCTAYQSKSTMLRQMQQPIAQWSESNVKDWSEAVKAHYNAPGPRKYIPQKELLAVLQRAVELVHGFTPRATQLLSVLTLLNTPEQKGRLAQIYTGEGKSLIVAMLAIAHALQGNKVDVLTTSVELSIPEVEKQKPFFALFGLTVGENSKENAVEDADRKAVYQKDVVYGTAEDFQADIINTSFFRRDIRNERGFGVALVDEVDSMLYDGRNWNTQLSELSPAMNHLTIMLGMIWSQINVIASQLQTIDGQTYYKQLKDEDPEQDAEATESKQEQQTAKATESKQEQQPAEAQENPSEEETKEGFELIPIPDPIHFLQNATQDYLSGLLRELSPEECQQLADHKDQERRVEELQKEVQEQGESKQSSLDAAIEALSKTSWSKTNKEQPYLREVPKHLRVFARKQVKHWQNSAIEALLCYQKDRHYHVKDGKIVAIDYSNTGVLQHNTVWENGLTQFLQIKEGLKVTPEGISTNFLSKPGYFKRYKSRIYGLTGTLGNETTRSFLTNVYGVDMVNIPSYKQRNIAGNDTSCYRCKELKPQLVNNTEAWYETISKCTLRSARNGQAVLVLCQYIQQVHELQKRLALKYDTDKLFTYTGEKDFNKHQVDSGEIIIATNIAGRGTDLTTSQAVEDNGGLHVCITFLPNSYRVELQNAGRTARQGKKGSAQLVLCTTVGDTLEKLRTQRDEEEAKDIGKATQEVGDRLMADRLFMRYCGVEASFFPTMEALQKVNLVQQLTTHWEAYAENAMSDREIQAAYEAEIQGLLEEGLKRHEDKLQKHEASVEEALQETESCTQAAYSEERDALRQELENKLKEEMPIDTFRKDLVKAMHAAFVQNAQSWVKIPIDLLEAAMSGKMYAPSSPTTPEASFTEKIIQKAIQHGWTEYERKGIRERWGLWLKADNAEEDKASAARHLRFDDFKKTLKADAMQNQLIQNPYYYVHKGNELLQNGSFTLATCAYDKAIALDPQYSANARFNKARALVFPKKNKDNHAAAKRELREAQYCIKQQKNALTSFDTLVGQTGAKPITSQHVQHQLDILSQQENYIQAAISAIETAQENDWDVEITEVKTVQELFKDAPDSRMQAVEEAACNGFTQVFTIKEKQPKRWWSIVAIAAIGLAQIGLAALCTSVGLANLVSNFIEQGIADLMAAFKAAKGGGYFSWKEWAIQKVISIAVACISGVFKAAKNWIAKKLPVKLKTGIDKVLGKFRKIKHKFRVGIQKKNIPQVRAQMKDAFKQLATGITKDLVQTMCYHEVDGLLVEHISAAVEKQVTDRIIETLEKNTVIQAAITLDNKNDSNYWQNILQQEGLTLLNDNQNEFRRACKEVLKGVITKEILDQFKDRQGLGIQIVKECIQNSPQIAEAAHKSLTLTSKFLKKFEHSIQTKYKQQVEQAQAEQEQREEEQQAETQAQEQETVAQVVSAPPPVAVDEISVPTITINQAYKSDLRNYYYEAPSNKGNLYSALSGHLTSQITSTIQQGIIHPLIDIGVNTGVDVGFSSISRAIEKEKERFREQTGNTDDGMEEHVSTQWKRESDEGRQKEQSAANQEAATSKNAEQPAVSVNPKAQEAADELRRGAQGDRVTLAQIGEKYKRRIEVHEPNKKGKSKLVEVIGAELGGEPLKVIYTPPKEPGGEGHWEPYLSKRDIKRGKTFRQIDSSGENNCMFAAIACQVNDVKSATELRHKVADHINTHPNTAHLRTLQENQRIVDRAALKEGGFSHQGMMHAYVHDPHGSYNQDCLAKRNPEYAALREVVNSTADQAQKSALQEQCRAMELAAYRASQEQAGKAACYMLQFGAGAGASVLAARFGTIAAYAAGTSAFVGVGIASDKEVHASIGVGDWSGALYYSSDHLPLLGVGRRTWEAWQADKPWDAAGYASLLSIEALGGREAGKVVRWGGKLTKRSKAFHKPAKNTPLIRFEVGEESKHFSKHGRRIMDVLGRKSYNLTDYVKDANYVIEYGTFVPEINAYVKLIGGNDAKFGFVGINRANGKLTTFHIKTAKELAKKAPSLGIEF